MTKRSRLTPHDRRMQLLDCAGRILLDQGLSKFTIDALAKEAAVSTPLIYKYFDTRIEILQALLSRESERIAIDLKDRLAVSQNYDDFVRLFVVMDFDGARTGNLLSMLFSQPDIRERFDSKKLNWIYDELINRTVQEFDVSSRQARRLVLMASAASRVAAQQSSRAEGDREQAIDDTLRFILGALRAVGSSTAPR